MSLLDTLKEHLDPKTIGGIASHLGIDPAMAQSAVESALPVIVGALAKNSAQPEGAAKLDKALEKDHAATGPAPSLFEQLSAAGPKLAEDGQKILGHIFGDKKAAAAEGVAGKSGLPIASVTNILGTLAPIVMGAIGKKKQSEGLDAAGVAAALGAAAEQHTAEQSVASAQPSADASEDVNQSVAPGDAGMSEAP